MRISPALVALFPKVRQGVLAATLTQPGKWWYLSELAQFLHATPSSLQRHPRAAAGEDPDLFQGRKPLSPVSGFARSFEKTAGMLPGLQQALHPFRDRIACVFCMDLSPSGRR